jgi:hypothetical protein
MAAKPFPSQAPDLVCACGHTGRDHCDDGECIHDGVASDGISFACGCTRWRPVEAKSVGDIWITEDKRKIPVVEMTDSHVLNSLRAFRARAVAEALAPDFEEGDFRFLVQKTHRQRIAARVAMMEREAARRGLDV